jgi:hypothetical protein
MDTKVPLEKETFSFFAYVKDIMLDAETDHCEYYFHFIIHVLKRETVMLSDVLPVESTSKSVAAQAFYHGTARHFCFGKRLKTHFILVLVLATRQVCGVTQDGNSAGIGIHLLNAS